jgi:hypothetical protein
MGGRFTAGAAGDEVDLVFHERYLGLALRKTTIKVVDARDHRNHRLTFAWAVSCLPRSGDGSLGAVEKSGRVRVGDLLVAVNGESLLDRWLTHTDAIRRITLTTRPLRLTFCRLKACEHRRRWMKKELMRAVVAVGAERERTAILAGGAMDVDQYQQLPDRTTDGGTGKQFTRHFQPFKAGLQSAMDNIRGKLKLNSRRATQISSADHSFEEAAATGSGDADTLTPVKRVRSSTGTSLEVDAGSSSLVAALGRGHTPQVGTGAAASLASDNAARLSLARRGRTMTPEDPSRPASGVPLFSLASALSAEESTTAAARAASARRASFTGIASSGLLTSTAREHQVVSDRLSAKYVAKRARSRGNTAGSLSGSNTVSLESNLRATTDAIGLVLEDHITAETLPQSLLTPPVSPALRPLRRRPPRRPPVAAAAVASSSSSVAETSIDMDAPSYQLDGGSASSSPVAAGGTVPGGTGSSYTGLSPSVLTESATTLPGDTTPGIVDPLADPSVPQSQLAEMEADEESVGGEDESSEEETRAVPSGLADDEASDASDYEAVIYVKETRSAQPAVKSITQAHTQLRNMTLDPIAGLMHLGNLIAPTALDKAYKGEADTHPLAIASAGFLHRHWNNVLDHVLDGFETLAAVPKVAIQSIQNGVVGSSRPASPSHRRRTSRVGSAVGAVGGSPDSSGRHDVEIGVVGNTHDDYNVARNLGFFSDRKLSVEKSLLDSEY